MHKNYKPTIGLEIHCELRTDSKLFCGCPADHFAKAPNTQTCPVCLGLPGELPVTNKKAVEWTILFGLAVNSKINKEAKFDRKHYFYPDLPMGFQISQYDEPFCLGGFIDTSEGRVNLTRVHLEIDTGKLQHTTLDGQDVSLIDFNRSGVALMEIVSEPEIHSGKQAKEYAKNIQQIIRYLGISDSDMEKGSMRLEANISWGLDLGYKVEVKNLNSFRFLEKAINYELERQKICLDADEKIIQETRGWNENKQRTFSQRTKETAEDYRYFPDPDLPPFSFDDEYIEKVKEMLPELPKVKKVRFVQEYGLPENYADILVDDRKKADFYEKVFELSVKEKIDPKLIANLIVNKGLSGGTPIELISKVKQMTVMNYASEDEVKKAVLDVLEENDNALKEYRNGKTQVIGFLIGMVQKKLSGKGNPAMISSVLLNSVK
jgi:aspartyl-tRNA(Asn)/glutamyl-tRNA(Gln) amidotransferase subunit B